MPTTSRSVECLFRYIDSTNQRSYTRHRGLPTFVHSSTVTSYESSRLVFHRTCACRYVGKSYRSDLQFWHWIIERLSIRIALDGIMVLDLARITSDHQLGDQCDSKRDNSVHTTDRIESIDTIHRYSRSSDQRHHSAVCELHVELHCCSNLLVDTISIIDDLVWISVIDINQDDIDLEQWAWIAERVSIGIALDGIMVLDLARIASDLELESRIAFIDHLDRVHTTDRIESIDTIHRHSGSSDQRHHSAVCELHVELHCCSIVLVDTISIIDDLVWISVIVIDQDGIDLEQWRWIAERVSIGIALDGIMVLDLARIASDLELESRIAFIDHLDRVHTTDRIESIDTIHRHSGSSDQRHHSAVCELHVELHCCSIVLVDTISIIDDLVWISVIVIDQDGIDLEQWRWIAERVSIGIALDGIMVLDLARITSDLELESRIRIIDHLDHMYSAFECGRSIHGHTCPIE